MDAPAPGAARFEVNSNCGLRFSPRTKAQTNMLSALLSTAAQCCPAVLARLLADIADFARKFNIAVLATVHLDTTSATSGELPRRASK